MTEEVVPIKAACYGPAISATPIELMSQAIMRAEAEIWKRVETCVKAHWPPPPGYSVCVGRMEIEPGQDDCFHLFNLRTWVGIYPSNAIPPNCVELMMPGEGDQAKEAP